MLEGVWGSSTGDVVSLCGTAGVVGLEDKGKAALSLPLPMHSQNPIPTQEQEHAVRHGQVPFSSSPPSLMNRSHQV